MIRGAGALVAGLIGALLLVLALGLFGVYGVGWFKRTTADYRGQTGVREKTLADPDYRIAAYEKFYDACASVQALEDQIANTRAEKPPHWRVNVVALQNQRANLIRDYNADSRKAGTQAQFKASDLPYQLNVEEKTAC